MLNGEDVALRRLCRNANRRAECLPTIERTVKHDRIRRVIIPADIHLAVGINGRRSTNGMSLSFGIVDANGGESSAVVTRGGEANASAGRAARSCVPGNVNVIA